MVCVKQSRAQHVLPFIMPFLTHSGSSAVHSKMFLGSIIFKNLITLEAASCQTVECYNWHERLRNSQDPTMHRESFTGENMRRISS